MKRLFATNNLLRVGLAICFIGFGAIVLFRLYTTQNQPQLTCICPILRKITIPKGYIAHPVWSPVGNWIAFERSEVSFEHPAIILSATSEIYIVKSDGNGLEQLTQDRVTDGSPSWSPDSKSLIYASLNDVVKPQKFYLSRFDIETKNTSVVFTCPDRCSAPAWSPDGKQIAFEMMDSEVVPRSWNIWLLNLETLETLKLAPQGIHISNMTWSPDSQYLLITRRDPKTNKGLILKLSIDSLEEEEMLSSDGSLSDPSWYPAKNVFAVVNSFREADTLSRNIFIVNGDTLTPVLNPVTDGYVNEPTLSPDENNLAFVYHWGLLGELYVAELK